MGFYQNSKPLPPIFQRFSPSPVVGPRAGSALMAAGLALRSWTRELHFCLHSVCFYFFFCLFVFLLHIPCLLLLFLFSNTLVFYHLEWTHLFPAKETIGFLAPWENILTDIWAPESLEQLYCSSCHSSLVSLDGRHPKLLPCDGYMNLPERLPPQTLSSFFCPSLITSLG